MLYAVNSDSPPRPNRERHAFQRELHDGVGPLLAGIGFGLAALERSLDEDRDSAAARVRELRGQVREAIEEVRRVAGGRAPGAIAHGDLGSALRALARLSSGPQVRVVAEELALPPTIQACLYRIASEALTNALRHAGARVVELRLRRVGPSVVLTVSDDGSWAAGGARPRGRARLDGRARGGAGR